MDTTPADLPPQDERLLAALAHFTAIMPGMGLLAPLVIWFTQRKKSAYVTFQALQALGYQALVFALGMAMMILIPIVIAFVAFFLMAVTTADGSDPGFIIFLPQLIMFGSIFGGMGLYILTGIIGAGMCLGGRNFHYPLLGRWLENYLKEGTA